MLTKKDGSSEADRLKALTKYEQLDAVQHAAYDRLTALAANICGTPIALISLLDENKQLIQSQTGFGQTKIPENIAFCEHTFQQSGLLEIEDTTLDERSVNDPLVTSAPNIRFYAGYPLTDHEGYSIGTICVMDTVPKNLTLQQKEALKLLAESTIELMIKHQEKLESLQCERLFTLSNDFICVANANGEVIRENPAFSKLRSWMESSDAKKKFDHFIHPKNLPAALEAKQKSVNGLSQTFSSLCQTQNNEELIIEWVATIESTTNDMFAIGRDITSERKRELILAESENKFRSFFENSQGLMCIHDTEGNFTSVNSAGAGMLGYTVDEVLHMSLYDLVSSDFHKELDLYLKKILRKKKANGILNFLHKNGTPKIWMFNNIYEETPDGKGKIIGNAIDITELHQLEKDLKNTKKMLEETNQIAMIGGWDLDPIHKTLFWSDITKKIHEVPADYTPNLETSIYFYKAGESRERITKLVEQGMQDGTGWDEELQVITAKGNEIWVRAIGTAEFVNGKCKRLFGTFQNIDDKKRAAVEIYNSRKQLHDLLQSASEVSIISTDPNGIINLFNRGAEHMLGYSADEMINKQTPAILHDPLEMQIREAELTAEYNKPIQGSLVFIYKSQLNGSEQGEWTYIKKDGSRIIVSLVMSCIRENDGTITGYLGVATDITASKEAQAALTYEKSRLQAFVKHAPAAVAMFDRDIKYIAVSNRWIEEYHLQGMDVIGKSHYDIFPNISKEWKNIHARCMAGAVEKHNEDIWRPDGWDNDQYLKWEVRPWYLFDGSIGGIMMFTQDITEVSLQRKELYLAKKQAEQASIAKSEFLANMSHEIRTPLNGVIGFTDLLLKTEINETQKQYLSIVNHSGNALLSIINDILDFSKIEAGKLELDIEKCDLFDLGSQAADIISYQAQLKELELLLNISTDLPRFIWTDDIRLKQVLINLLGNATKFTEHGEIELKIFPLKTVSSSPDNLQIRFEVRDTGIGIKPEKQGKIFEAFLQEDASTTKKYGGTGLGLTISNKLLHLMGSELKLKSEYGKGSTFYFDLTVKVEQGEPINWKGIENIKDVLIVDDNDNNRMILRQMLLLKQISSDEARNGIEALTLLSAGKKKYDVIFMDYHMPIMDGIETIRKIRGSFFSTSNEQPIILLYSSSSDETVIKACEELDVSYRIVKPLKMQEMFDTLSRLTQKEQDNTAEQLAANPTSPGIGHITVLLVEDNHFNMLLASSIIKRIIPDVNLVEKDNGLDAIAYCEKVVPDIIFMDIQMPGKNGYETTIEIRAIEELQYTPIIALTAGNLKGEREKCIEAGMNDFLAKPIIETMIADILDKWLLKKIRKDDYKNRDEVVDENRFNLKGLKEIAAGDDSFLKEVLAVAKKDILASPTILQEALKAGDISLLKLKAHSLKGVALSLGAAKLAEPAAAIEYSETINHDDVIALIDLIKKEINYIVPLMTKLIEA